MTGNEIRQRFLDFFASRGHRIVRSSSLVPGNDPTLLFTNAGMNQFKEIFQGLEQRDYSRATSSQKCVRAGGKHNDLENVGYTRRHHTFFEMLGNFSFGDYFKADAIQFAWDLITKDYGLDKDRLYITVFREDDEAEALWQSVAGVPKSRIFRLDEADNFWQMGDTGPCGPCSEIHYDLGPEAAEPGRENESFPLDGGGRFVEIWNLVFMQFNRDISGAMTPLPRPSIDTGMGLERVAAILQGKITNYDTDLIYPIMERAADLCDVTLGTDPRIDTALRINADHARATAFLINDGVLPANEGRGYVLRKIMRRAMRNARLIGKQDPYLHQLTGFVAEHMSAAYPEMMESVQRVARIVKDEEHRYASTFLVAERVFNDEVAKITTGVVPGTLAFKLYDTFGLALDEQEDMARDRGFQIDVEGFQAAMQGQRELARASWKGAEKGHVSPAYQQLLAKGKTKFLGYTQLEATCTVTGIVLNNELVDAAAPRKTGTDTDFRALGENSLPAHPAAPRKTGTDTDFRALGENALPAPPAAPRKTGTDTDFRALGENSVSVPLLPLEIVLNQTPFYAETGGQIGDKGNLIDAHTGELVAQVLNTYPAMPGVSAHKVRLLQPIRVGMELKGEVAAPERLSTQRNHTATHLLHAALRTTLGLHVKQAGSVVEPPRLRFDFTHYAALDSAEIAEVERLVNREILHNTPVTTDILPIDQAIQSGAMALFGEKYGDEVRVVQIPGFSKELCGGTHVARTGDIGLFKIISESSISAGVRRIEGITGEAAVSTFQHTTDAVQRLANMMKVGAPELIESVEKLISDKRDSDRLIDNLKTKIAQSAGRDLESKVQEKNGVKFIAARLDALDRSQLRTLADDLRNKWQSAVVVLTSVEDGAVSIVAAVTKDVTAKVQAGKLVGSVAQAVGGKGGGRPDMAEGGGKDPAQLQHALTAIAAEIESKL